MVHTSFLTQISVQLLDERAVSSVDIGGLDGMSLLVGGVVVLVALLAVQWLIFHRRAGKEHGGELSAVEVDRYATIFESANEGIVVLDPDGNVTEINPAACRLFNVNARAVIGMPATELGLLSVAEIRLLPKLHRQDNPQSVVRQVGNRVVSTIVSPLRTVPARRRRAESVWLLRDVTEAVRMEETRNEFISVVSHELRTPMTAIKGFTDLLLDGDAGNVTRQQRELLTVVQGNANRLVNLVNDMLDMSRIESGRIQLDQTAVDVIAAIRNVVRSLQPVQEAKNLNILEELDPTAPRVYADEARLTQILTNLVANAYKYTPDNGWITVRAEVLDTFVAVSVSDTGIGIPADALQHVFTKFFRVEHPTTQAVSGTGLGLAITRLLVERHGGRITAASREGVGTTVRFTLPVARDRWADGNGEGEPPVVLVATADPRDRRAWGESIPALTIYPRSQSVRAIVGEAELHRPAVIVIRPQAARAGLQLLLDDLDAVPELADTPLVLVGGTSQSLRETARRVVFLRSDAGPDHVSAVVRDLLPHGDPVPQRRGRILLGVNDGGNGAALYDRLDAAGFNVTQVRDGLAAIVRAIEMLPDAIVIQDDLYRLDAQAVLHQLREYPGTEQIPVIVVAGAGPIDAAALLSAGASDIMAAPIDSDALVARLTDLTEAPADEVIDLSVTTL
ncbi:MAG: ATP-binding protein [Thermomicrobiales bacterium]|nr:ATP-binding protein [Thermomicrobiales bacterium]